MKRILLIIVVLGFAVSAEATDVGVSLSVGQPGFYGQIDIGNFPRPQVVYAKPVVIAPVPVHTISHPIYLHVPPGHAKHWAKHCDEYNACGRPVYFVREQWYNDVYVPEYHARHGHKGGDDDRGDGNNDRKHGNGHGHGGGHGKK